MMDQFQPQEPAEPFNPATDKYTTGLIAWRVDQLLLQSGFGPDDRVDLTQELLARVVKSFEQFDARVGHPYPFIKAVIERHVANLQRSRYAAKRDCGAIMSLNVNVAVDGTESTELIQTIGDREIDRRLGRERRLSEEELSNLRRDLAEVMATLPEPWQRLLELSKTHRLEEISREMGVPRSTLRTWLEKIRIRFVEKGLDGYFTK